jgi:hypothetical protein
MRQSSLFPCLLVVIAAGCVDGGRPLEPRSDPRLRDRVVELGFRPDMIVDQGSTFLVEGDIEISKHDLAAGGVPAGHVPGVRRALGGASYQYIGDRTVTNENYPERPIYVYITNLLRSSHPEWAQAVRSAMAQWNSLGGFNLKFVEVGSQSASDILVTTYTHYTDEVAKSAWPSRGGSPGAYVWINLGYQRGLGSGGQPVYASKVFHMVHELGHTIGFRHSNYLLLGENGSDSIGTHLIPNTHILDSLSVMNGGANRRTWTGFSSGDRIAARAVYMGSVRVAPDLDNGHPRLSWNVEPDAYEYRIFRVSGYPFPIEEQIGTATWGLFTDESITASIARPCGVAEFPTYVYYVLAYFPEGTVTRRVAPEVCVY